MPQSESTRIDDAAQTRRPAAMPAPPTPPSPQTGPAPVDRSALDQKVMAGRIAVLGDLSGHLTPLLGVLEDLGIELGGPDPQFPTEVISWPEDLYVVQVGDLVHKGPASELIVALVSGVLLPTGRWVQLCGNHEAQYVPDGPSFWRPQLERRAAEEVARWWESGHMLAALAVDDDRLGPVLITHGGISPKRHEQALRMARKGRLGDDHVAIAAWLNTAPISSAARKAVLTPGLMLGMSGTEPGVVWTESRRELRLPWLRWSRNGSLLDDAMVRPLPYSQVHGHTTPLLLARGRAPRVPDDLAGWTVIDPRTDHVVSTYGQGPTGPSTPRQIVAIDPGANARRIIAPKPYLLSGRIHLAAAGDASEAA